MSSWSRKFHKPVFPRTGRPIETLAQARVYVLALGDATRRNEWQHATARLLDAAGGGNARIAYEALRNAMFLNMMLDLGRE